MSVTQEIQQAIEQSLQNLGISVPASIEVFPASDSRFGDYSSNIAMKIFKSNVRKVPGKKEGDPFILNGAVLLNPRELAECIIREIKILQPTTYNLSSAFPGFINFTLSDEYFTATLREIIENKQVVKNKGRSPVIVEYSSPNIAKPFTVGHLRSTIIGDAVANLLETQGSDVRRDNHLGDWGTQFGKLIVAIKKWGDIQTISSAVNPVKELVALYIRFHEEAEKDPKLEDEGRAWFTKLEQGDQEARALWQQCIDWSWQEFSRIYAELGVTFTENGGKGYGESFFEDKMADVIRELRNSGHLKKGEEGAELFFFPDEELPPLMVLKKDGSTLYATRDLATDKFRLSHYGKDIVVINEVGAEQELYFRQIYRVEELLGWFTVGKRVHVKHGHFRFAEGKMSTRKGNVIWLQDVIDEAKKRAAQFSTLNSQLSIPTVAIGAIKWNDLKRAAHLDVTFDWDEILTMDGNSGPYLQYTAVRAKSILHKVGSDQKTVNSGQLFQFDASEREVVRQLSYYRDTLARAAAEYAPHHLCTYLYTLASTFNSFYNSHKVIGSGVEEHKRTTITRVVSQILTDGLHVLGIGVPEEM